MSVHNEHPDEAQQPPSEAATGPASSIPADTTDTTDPIETAATPTEPPGSGVLPPPGLMTVSPPYAGYPVAPPGFPAVPMEPASTAAPAPVAPAPPGPPRSPIAVALLNVTGLGLGYLYLGRRLRAALSLALTLALVATAFTTDAADRPWLWRAIAVVWIGLMALDGWRLARRHPDSATAPTRQPALVAAAAILAIAAGYVLYGVAGNRTFDAGQAAKAAGDCGTATARYDQVTGLFELTLSGNVAAAATQRAYCQAYLLAIAEHEGGRFDSAIARYHEYLTSTPANSLDSFAHANLQRAYLEWGQSARADNDYQTAKTAYRNLLNEYGEGEVAERARAELAQTYFDEAAAFRAKLDPAGGGSAVDPVRGAMQNYLQIQREFPQTKWAAEAPKAILETFNEAVRPFTAGKFCESLPILDYLTGMPPAESAGVVGSAHENRAKAVFECGVLRYGAGQFSEAGGLFEKLTVEYPNHALAAMAGSALIAATIAAEGPPAIPKLPPPLGGDTPGSISVTFYNDSPQETEILISGPTAHRFTLPGCPTCPEEYANEADGCQELAGRPSRRLRLLPGDYQLLNQDLQGMARPLVDTVTVTGGYTHTYCVFQQAAP
jgi:tetratricopeptide (TPR) repeat protein